MSSFRAGDSIACSINCSEKNGFAVTTLQHNLPGFIKTTVHYKRGEEITAVYVCFRNGRVILTDPFAYKNIKDDFFGHPGTDWAEYLTDRVLEGAYAQHLPAKDSLPNRKLSLVEAAGVRLDDTEDDANVIQVDFVKRKKDD